MNIEILRLISDFSGCDRSNFWDMYNCDRSMAFVRSVEQFESLNVAEMDLMECIADYWDTLMDVYDEPKTIVDIFRPSKIKQAQDAAGDFLEQVAPAK